MSNRKAMTDLAEAAAALERDAARRPNAPTDSVIGVGGERVDLSAPIPQTISNRELERKFPRYVVAGDGRIYDTDHQDGAGNPVPVDLRDTITLDNRVLSVGEFGQDGSGIVIQMYEDFLRAHQGDFNAEYRQSDGSGRILMFLKNADAHKMLRTRTDPKTMERVHYVPWGSPHVTFEQWCHWGVATMLWRIKVDLPHRYDAEIDIRKRADMSTAKAFMESSLIAIEKYLALPERGRLIGV